MFSRANGVLGRFGYYFPKMLIKEHGALLSSGYGLAGEENRKTLAGLFKLPTTWGYYCANVSDSTCDVDDGTAMRAPSKEEEEYYFMKGAFKGHFREDNSTDCENFPDTCMGHIIVPSCDWSVYSEAQMYWNNISLSSKMGPNAPNGGYDGIRIEQIYKAANATRSPIIVWFNDPTAMVESFHGTDYELMRISLR